MNYYSKGSNNLKQNKNKTNLILLGFFAIIMIISLCLILPSINAWFSAVSNREGEITFSTLSLNLQDNTNSTHETNSTFTTKYLSNIAPGSTININDTKIKNSGNASIYALVNLDVSIEQQGKTTLHWNTWYDLNGNQVYTDNLALNTTGATLLDAEQEQSLDISWTFPGEVITNDYKNATAKVVLSAQGVQTYLPNAVGYQDKSQYATYFIIDQVFEEIVATNSKNLNNKDKMISGFLPQAGAYPTSNSSYPNASYQILEIKQGQTFSVGYVGDNAYKGRIRCIDNETNEVVGTVMTNNNIYYTSTSNYNNGFVDGEITAKKDFKLGIMFIDTLPANFNLKIVNLIGENLLNIDEGLNSELVKNNDGSYTFTKKSDTNRFSNTFNVNLKAGKTYTISTGETHELSLKFYQSSPTAYFALGANRTSGTFTPSVDITKIKIYFDASAASNGMPDGTSITFSKLKIEEGSVATAYTPYVNKIDYSVPKLEDPLMQVGETKDTIDYTTNIITRNVKKLVLTGTESWSDVGAVNSVYRYRISPDDIKLGYSNAVCNYYNISSQTQFAIIDEVSFTTHPTSKEISFFVKYNTLDAWKNYLKDRYAKGDPVIVWYKLDTNYIETETIFVGKNYYTGPQLLTYQTNGTQNNTTHSGTVRITETAQAKVYSDGAIELGGDLFEFIKDKPITISCKIKINYQEVNYPRIGIAYYEEGGTSSVVHKQGFINNIPVDGNWHYVWVTAPAATSYDYDINRIYLWYADYNAIKDDNGNNISVRDFQIKDIQLEVGQTPTEFTSLFNIDI